MGKVAILLDSTFYMSSTDLEQYGFYTVPLSVNFENISFFENAQDKSQVVDVFSKIERAKKLPQTSQPSTADALKVFTKIANDGYERVISLHLSSALSGTTQGMRIAANQYMEENDNLTIEVFDTRTAGQIAAYTAKTIASVINQTGDITTEHINQIIEFVATNSETYVFVDKLDYLAYGGRIPATIASIGNLFGVSPIITVNQQGGLDKYKTERSQKKAIISIIELLASRNYNAEDRILLNSFYTTDSKMAKRVIKEATKVTEATIVQSEIDQLGIVISNHLGPNAFALSWIKEYKI